MDYKVIAILALLGGLIIGIIATFVAFMIRERKAISKAAKMIEQAKKESDKQKRDTLLEIKEESYRLKQETDKEVKEKS